MPGVAGFAFIQALNHPVTNQLSPSIRFFAVLFGRPVALDLHAVGGALDPHFTAEVFRTAGLDALPAAVSGQFDHIHGGGTVGIPGGQLIALVHDGRALIVIGAEQLPLVRVFRDQETFFKAAGHAEAGLLLGVLRGRAPRFDFTVLLRLPNHRIRSRFLDIDLTSGFFQQTSARGVFLRNCLFGSLLRLRLNNLLPMIFHIRPFPVSAVCPARQALPECRAYPAVLSVFG